MKVSVIIVSFAQSNLTSMDHMKALVASFLLVIIAIFFVPLNSDCQNPIDWKEIPDSLYKGIKYRNIGPFLGTRSVHGGGYFPNH